MPRERATSCKEAVVCVTKSVLLSRHGPVILNFVDYGIEIAFRLSGPEVQPNLMRAYN
jgi:hypothetical protein